ncbi:unnamed protein product [Mesocestoides corti]|uniref:Uncharacterized protein n=1 Tax=Mesocestoides corti TaxID=53468 RepID=A0A0R3UCK2_MESCO|nr:unnamed protein product [Mesocestoides corti]
MDHIHRTTAPRTGPIRFQMSRADPDGMFMTEHLQQMLFCTKTDKQMLYRLQRETFIRDDLKVVDIPYRSFCECSVHVAFT